MKTKYKLIFLSFFLVLPFSIAYIDYSNLVDYCTNSTLDSSGVGTCASIYDNVNTSGFGSVNEWIPNRTDEYPGNENVTIYFKTGIVNLQNVKVGFSCVIGGVQNPEAVELYGYTADNFYLLGYANQSATGDSTCNGPNENNENSKQSLTLTSNLNYTFTSLALVVNRSNQSVIDGVNELHLNFAGNISNQQPLINISYEDEICFNSSNSKAYFNYTVSMYDYEGDSLLIGNKLTSFRDIFRYITFSKQSCELNLFGFDLGCSQKEDYTALAIGSFYLPNSCRINQGFPNISMLNVLQYGDSYMFNLQDSCTGDKQWLYKMENTFNNLALNFKIIQWTNNDEFNLTLTDSYQVPVGKVNIKNENGNLLIYDLNSTAKLIYNQSFSGDLDLTFTEYPELDYIEVKNADTNVILTNYTYLDSLDTAIFKLDFKGNFFIENAYYHGTQNTPIFSSFTSPNTYYFTANYSGDYKFNVYYKDNVHTTYETQEITFTAVPSSKCKYIFSDKLGEEENAVSRIDILGLIKGLIGSPLRNFFDTMGLTDTAKTLLYWIFVFMVIGLMFTEYMLVRKIDFIFPVIVSSIACGFVAMILEFTGQLAVFLITLSLSLTPPFVNAVFGGGNHK